MAPFWSAWAKFGPLYRDFLSGPASFSSERGRLEVDSQHARCALADFVGDIQAIHPGHVCRSSFLPSSETLPFSPVGRGLPNPCRVRRRT